MSWLGDIRLGDTLDFKFCTVQSTGAPTTLSGVPVISAYSSNSTTQLTAGITLSVDFDSVTGLNQVRVVASSGNGYATATNYDMVITTGTVNSVSVVGYVVGSFSIENRSAVMPTTAARTLDVSATGEAGVDWANVGSPTTTVGLSGTTVGTATAVGTLTTYTGNTPQTGDSFARLGAPAGASIEADIAAVKTDTAAVKVQTDKLAFTVANQVDANVLKVGGTTQTARDLGASVLLSSGSGTGQLDFTSGVVKASVAQVLGTAFTEGAAGRIAAAFKQFFNIATPAATMDHGVLVDTVTTATTASALTTNNDKTGYALTSGERNSVADALLDRSAGVETSFTPRQSFRLMLSALAGKLSGAATTTVTIRDVNDAKNRIVATVDADGNRSAVTTDVS